MTNSKTLRPLLSLLSLAIAVVVLPSTASADRGRVHLEDGSVIQGEIVTYDPGSGVTVQLANGSTIELSADDVARVQIGIDEAPTPAQTAAVATAPAAYPQATAPAPAPARPIPGRPRLAGPLVLGSVGVLLVAIGAPMYTNSFTYSDTYEFTGQGIAGMTLMGMGGALMISGFGIWLALRVKARRAWDAEHGSALRVTPAVGRRHAGLQLSGTF